MTITDLLEEAGAGQSGKRLHGELEGIALKDVRNRRRLEQMLTAMTDNPGKSLPELGEDAGDAKAFYRLVAQPDLSDEAILQAHARSTLTRAFESGAQVLLAAQDTTTLNFTSRPKLEGRGSIGSDRGLGLYAHSTMLLDAHSGEIHGLVSSKIYARDDSKAQERAAGARNRQKIEEKESVRWLESFKAAVGVREYLAAAGSATQVVSVADREGDIYELLCLASEHESNGVGLIVRSRHNRAQCGEEQRVWESLAASPQREHFSIALPRRAGLKSREVEVELRFKKVDLQVPRDRAKYQGITQTVTATLIEVRGEDGDGPLLWRLLTTLPVNSAQTARQIAGWYALRWQIEVFHRVLKTGCRVERRQMRTMDRLRPVIALDMIVAVHLMGVLSLSRARPQTPARVCLGPEQTEALCRFLAKENLSPESLSITEAVRHIARLGGFLARKGDGDPGAEVLWRGIQKLHVITEAWTAFRNGEKCG